MRTAFAQACRLGLTVFFILAIQGRPWSAPGGEKRTALWIPLDSFDQWGNIDALLERYPSLRFTLAVAPEDLTPQAAKRLSALRAAGRLELALRLKGNPILPLIANHPEAPRPQDALNRLAAARDSFKNLLGALPSGFAPGAGAVSPALFSAFNAMDLSWVATARSSPTWSAAGKTILAPFSTDTNKDLFVIDEADGLSPAGSGLALLRALADKHPRGGWGLVLETTAEKRTQGLSDATAMNQWPTWAGGFETWISTPAAQRAWKVYGETALALERYQNSGAADLKGLEDATSALYLSQSGDYYRILSGPSGPSSQRADRELRGHMAEVYRKTTQTPPEALFNSFLDDQVSGPGSTDVHFSSGDSWLSFENPPAISSSELGKIKSLRVQWDPAGITFSVGMVQLELGPLLLDLYIDINHIVGAGSTSLLPARSGAVVARDGWEYALTISGGEALLYRSNSQKTPAARLTPIADTSKGEVSVFVPSEFIKGSPMRWGYILAAMDKTDPGAILGLLAPIERQKSLTAETRLPRLSAVRARGP